MATALDKDTEYLSTCCVCYETYDKDERKPKFLPCGHTLCLRCVEVNIDSSSSSYFMWLVLNWKHFISQGITPVGANRVTCPICRQVSELPRGTEGLRNNRYALHFLQLAEEKKKGQ